MTNVVIDTNIIISAALTPNGNPSKAIDIILTNDNIRLYYCVQIIDEYKRVLSRDKFKIAAEIQYAICNGIKQVGVMINPVKSNVPFTDESDRIFYDTAKTSESYLITGNTKHFPNESFIITPLGFLTMFNK